MQKAYLIFWIPTIFFVVALMGCAGSKTITNEEPNVIAKTSLDSLRAKFQLSILADGEMQNFDAVLFSVSQKRYRLELTGPLGIGVASLLWTESGWQMVFPTEKLFLKGNGYMVGLLQDSTLPLVHIHQVADLFYGKLLPENYKEVSPPKDSTKIEGAIYAQEKSGRLFSFAKDSVQNQIVWLNRIGRDGKRETIYYEDFKVVEGIKMPTVIRFERDNKEFLKIRVKKINRNKSFSLGVWRLNIPKSYKPVGS